MPNRASSPSSASRPSPAKDSPASPSIDVNDEAAMQHWCEHFGITRQQLDEAVKAVGTDRATLLRHLLSQGASAGPG